MTVRNIKKNLAGAEDLLHGIGVETQSRGGAFYDMHKLDTYVPTYDIEEMKRSSLTFMRMYWTDTNYTDFRRNPVGTVGITSYLGGVWEVAGDSLKLRQLLAKQCAEAGLVLVTGSFEEGGVINATNEVLWCMTDTKVYGWGTDETKTIAVGSAPIPIEAGAWVDRTDSTLRSFLASSLAASNIGTTKEISVEQRLLDIENSIPSQTPEFQQPSSLHESLASLLVYGIDNARNNILIIGDSITKNVGASNPKFSYAACLGKALSNLYKKGYGYPLHLNISNAADIVSYAGTAGQSGLGAESVTVSSSQALTMCKSEAIAVAAVIDGPNSSCSTIELRINGTAVASVTKPTGNPGIVFLVSPYKEWESCDVVTISPVGGSMVVLGATPLKRGDYNTANTTSPLIITCGASGQSFDYYTNNISQVGTLLNSLNADSPATCIIALGTNSIYNNTQAQTPSEYISSLTALIAAIAASATTNIVLTIPPKANETLWPVIKSGYTYDDYVAAIKSFASSTVYDVIDLNIPELPYVDGVHPNDAGHISIAKRYCDLLSIPADFGLPQIKLTSFLSGASPVIITNGYVSVDRNGTVTLKGKVNPNGAGTNLLTTLPIAYRPSVMRKFVVPLDTNGFGIVTIGVNGEVRMAHNSITWTYAYLDGISF